ncbi:hypothetical protein HYS10_01920 [Candidatus Collierbacteria bacterium]|nr:hypothetical protein [Candidatus Collierbacteria bacterium]
MKINLLKKRSLKAKRAETVRKINKISLIVGSSLFILSILFVSGRYVYLRVRANTLTESINQLEADVAGRSLEILEYARVKQILGVVNQVQSQRFKYKDVLSGLYNFLPSGAGLISVDFAGESVVTASIRFNGVVGYEDFLGRLDAGSEASNFLFKEIAEKSLTKDSAGKYQLNVEFKL